MAIKIALVFFPVVSIQTVKDSTQQNLINQQIFNCLTMKSVSEIITGVINTHFEVKHSW